MSNEIKQVIVVRLDLKMSKGKLAAQVAHASVSSAESARVGWHKWWRTWMIEGQKKVVLKIKDKNSLIEIYNKASSQHLPVSLISDRGLTELEPGTITCVGIGPAPSKLIDKFTGILPLL